MIAARLLLALGLPTALQLPTQSDVRSHVQPRVSDIPRNDESVKVWNAPQNVIEHHR